MRCTAEGKRVVKLEGESEGVSARLGYDERVLVE